MLVLERRLGQISSLSEPSPIHTCCLKSGRQMAEINPERNGTKKKFLGGGVCVNIIG